MSAHLIERSGRHVGLQITVKSTILDLKVNPKARGQDHHKIFCSAYVQLSRLGL